ncbi:MAG: hypothetical protein O3B81_03970 [Actinomycetota bacterium]|jgi:hypothetical protein|nr:hypothetical protein [Actinomycetota bacterium]MDA3026938.1 hypothetical protein [Actinomycetota bacterium]
MENQSDSSQNQQSELSLGALKPIIPSGDGRVDGATERLNELTLLPALEHVAVFEDVHRRLHDALTDNPE